MNKCPQCESKEKEIKIYKEGDAVVCKKCNYTLDFIWREFLN